MLGESIRGDLGNIICTVVIMATLLPMFVVLLLYAIDPTGHLLHRLCVSTKVDEKWDQVKELLLSVGGEDEEVQHHIKFAISEVEAGELDDAKIIMEIIVGLFQGMMALDKDAVKDGVCELLSAFGVPHKQSYALVDKLGLKLLAWALRPVFEPRLKKHGLEWTDVVPVLEEVDSIDELKEAVADPSGFLERLLNAGGSAAKKLAIMHLKPKLVPHLAKQGLEWADVVPVLEEVDSIDELKEAICDPMAFLDRISKAGAESLGIVVSASLHVLKVVPGGQGARNNVQAGDIISRVGSTNFSYDGSTQMDVEVGSLLNEARTRGEASVRIEFNDGAKSAEFKIKSRLTAAMASGKSQIMHQKMKSMTRGSMKRDRSRRRGRSMRGGSLEGQSKEGQMTKAAEELGKAPTSVVPMQAEAAAQLEPLSRERVQSALSAAAAGRTPAYGEDIGINMDSSVVRQLAHDLGVK
jgi:hypothetical protein